MENNNWYEDKANNTASGNTQSGTQNSNQPNYNYNYNPYQYNPYQNTNPYQGYQPPQPPHNEKPKKEKKSLGWQHLLAAILATALVVGSLSVLISGLITNANKDRLSDTDSKVSVEPTPELTDDPTAVTPEPDDTSIDDTDKDMPSNPSGGITLGQVWEAEDTLSAMLQTSMGSVVGIDILAEVSGGTYWYGSSSTSTQTVGSGSGVIITEDGYIVTCQHVVEGANTIIVYMQDGTEYEAQYIGGDDMTDLAVIKIDAEGLPAAPFGDSSDILIGDSVYAIGNPLGVLASSVSDGIISGLDRLVTVGNFEMTLMQTNAAVNPGNSGGALFNSKGELIGVVNAKATGNNVEGIGFAIPVNSALPIIEDLMDLGYVSGRPYLGITPQDIYMTGSRNMFGMQSYITRVQVADIEKGSCADKAGMQKEDIILTFDGQEVYGAAELAVILYNYEIGDTVVVNVYRDRETVSLTLTLEGR